MIIRASLLILAAVAALAVSGTVVAKPSRKRKPHLESSGDEDANRPSRHVEEKEENETADANRQQVIARQGKNPNGADEAERIKLLLNEQRRREIAVENKLLELYGLREQRSFIKHLKKQLRVRSSEADMLKSAVSSLEAEKSDLEKEIRESSAGEKQLEAAEKTVKQWQDKVNAREIQMKAQLNTIEERVYGFHSKEKSSGEPVTDGKKMKTMEDVKLEVLEMNRRNKELELEKRELALKLDSAQAKTSSLSAMTESEVIAGVKEEASGLKRGNEDLLKQIETLQKQRFGMVEELVYQKWLKSCLRFEIQDYRTPPRTPGRDPSEDWSFGSQQEVKPAACAASDRADSSQTSTESHEIDGTGSTLESTSGSQSSISKRSSLIAKIKRWNRSKGGIMVDASPERSHPSKRFSARAGLIRRFSTSMVPEARWDFATNSYRQTSKKDLAESPGPEIRSRQRRVSFNDHVSVRNLEPEFDDALPPGEMEPFSREIYDESSSRMPSRELADNATSVIQEDKAKKHWDVTTSEAISSSHHQSTDELEQNETNERAVSKTGPARSPEAPYGQMNRIEARSSSHVSAFFVFIFIFILLVPRFCSWVVFRLTAH